jgi:hypothetical protein
MKKILILSLVIFAIGCSKKSSDDDISFDGTLTINNASSLDQAITFGNQVSTLSGDLTITTGGSTGISSALVSQVTALINSVGGNVTVSSPDGPIDLSQLSSVGGNYSIEGSDANEDNLLTVDGDITLNYEGDYSMPNLTSAGRIFITPISTSTASKKIVGYTLSFPAISICLGISTLDSTVPIAPVAPVSTLLDLTDFSVNPIKSINFGSAIIIEDLIAPVATDIVIKNPLPLTKLNISAPLATKVDIATTAVNGPINIQTSTATGSTFSAPALATVLGDVAITCGLANFDNLTVIEGNCAITAISLAAPIIASVAGNLTITSGGVSMPNLGTVGGNVSVTGTGSNSIVDFTNLSNVGGNLNIEADDITQNTGQPHNSGGN